MVLIAHWSKEKSVKFQLFSCLFTVPFKDIAVRKSLSTGVLQCFTSI